MKHTLQTGVKKTFTFKRTLKLLSASSRFAPSQENLVIAYKCIGMSKQKITLRVVSKGAPDQPLLERELTADEKKNGNNSIQWDGKTNCTSGALLGTWVDPAHSPYKLSLLLDDKEVGSKAFQVEVGELLVDVKADHGRLLMNDPNGKFEVSATIKLKKSDGTSVITPLPLKVDFSFNGPRHLNQTKSYEYSPGKFLGTGAQTSVTHWDPSDVNVSSRDGFHQHCQAAVETAIGPAQGSATVHFKPSAVGGDSFVLEGALLSANGKKELFSTKSPKLTVWRSIDYDKVFTMSGETYIDAATVHAQIAPAFEQGGAHVLYSRQPVVTLPAHLTVKYIGLYVKGGGTRNWPVDFSPGALELTPNQLEPTAQERADYAAGGKPGEQAQKAIEAKAQKWFAAICQSYQQSVQDWFTDAGVPNTNSLLAVQYYHPKLSQVSTDGQTNFWPPGISINLANPGSGESMPGHPDVSTWRCVQGFNRGNISVIFKNYGTSTRLQIICRHEIGHATKSAFARRQFGTGDHSLGGLMTFDGASNTFSGADIHVLCGHK